ncbi:thiosulfate oxidation carrier protein SoxY, partial [Bradyrhizobium ottawaense]|uniref:thiosulfate oxidation carrier protein SoxY n=1 Tax=Bradyrhizobium ottawaense TaxID=931866 RepID=UPI0030C69DC5
PVSVTTTLDKVTSISFFVTENPYALAASYKIADGTIPGVANRLKMAKTTKLVAIVEADGKLYSATSRASKPGASIRASQTSAAPCGSIS